ncbi:hypothetical protein [Pseudomonas laurylsulfatiphila]|uniref:hypothetical protein n=1 Tax=Pseudomonas laurylsulfatiphila TaxID=2011015 RepID=UPI003D255723
MSSFVVTDKHISAILQGVYGKSHNGCNIWEWQVTPNSLHYLFSAKESQQQEANILMRENIRSVNHQYKLNDELDSDVLLFRKDAPLPVLTVLKLIDSLEHQSCECDDYNTTEAYKLLCRYRERLIPKLPGYNDAPWTI